MKHFKCSACSNTVNSKMKKCPNCGAKVAVPVGRAGIVLVIMFVVFMLYSMFGVESTSPTSSAVNNETSEEHCKDFITGVGKTPNNLKRIIRENLRDPKSYEDMGCIIVKQNEHGLHVMSQYRARNGFNGYTVGMVKFTVKDDDVVYSFE